jgi:hypothetical protein
MKNSVSINFKPIDLTPVKNSVKSFLSWQWVKKFLYWLVVSAGTVSECVFLIASIWVSLNATVHPLMLQVMSQATTVTFSQLSISMFTALPEIILGLAVVTTYGHIKFYVTHRRKSSLAWAILFGLPTVVFASLTTWTLIASALQIGYIMPSVLVASRVLAGYAYGFLSMLFVLIGEPDNADYVEKLKQETSDIIGRLENEIGRLNREMSRLLTDHSEEIDRQATAYSIEIENLTQMLKSSSSQINQLAERASSLELRGLDSYPKVVSMWIESGVKTVTLSDIEQVTGLSRQRINAAAKAGKFQRDNRKKDSFRVSSIIEWLKTIPASLPETPIPVSSQSNGHNLVSENHTDPLQLSALNLN